MNQSRKEALRKLYAVADTQHGFFTTKQAIQAGFSARSHFYHVKSRNWIREYRGIYRLARFPPPDRPDLVRWSLWSRNRQEAPEGVYSHETSLSLYDLSDVMPPKLHMTVPKSFRRNSLLPRALVLHRSDLSSSDTEMHQGVRVAKPLRTIIDLLEEGRISKSLLTQALREGLRRGLITQTAIKQASLSKKQRMELQGLLKSKE